MSQSAPPTSLLSLTATPTAAPPKGAANGAAFEHELAAASTPGESERRRSEPTTEARGAESADDASTTDQTSPADDTNAPETGVDDEPSPSQDASGETEDVGNDESLPLSALVTEGAVSPIDVQPTADDAFALTATTAGPAGVADGAPPSLELRGAPAAAPRLLEGGDTTPTTAAATTDGGNDTLPLDEPPIQVDPNALEDPNALGSSVATEVVAESRVVDPEAATPTKLERRSDPAAEARGSDAAFDNSDQSPDESKNTPQSPSNDKPAVDPGSRNLPPTSSGAEATAPNQPNTSADLNAAGTGSAPQGALQSAAEGVAETPTADGPQVDPARFVSRVARAFDLAGERGSGPIQIRLSPPELGTVQLKLEVSDGVLAASLETDTQAARNALLDNLPALRERLAEQDIRVEKFDVDVRDEGRQADVPERDDSQSQRDREAGDPTDPRSASTAEGGGRGPAGPSPVEGIRFTDQSINVVA